MSFSKFILDVIARQSEKIEQGFIAEIVSFDKKTMRAEIKPLLEYTTEANGKANKKTIETPNVENVPCEILYAGGYYIRPVYQKGDKVNCALKSSNISKPLDSGIRADTGDNRFSLSYCTVTGGVIPKDFTAPAAWSNKDGLIIGKDDLLTINIEDDGNLEIDNGNAFFRMNPNGRIDVLNDSGELNVMDGGDIRLNGNTDNAVAFADLKIVIEELQNDLTTIKAAFTAWTPVNNDGGAALKTASTTWAATPIIRDMDTAKVDNVKLS